MFSSPPPPAGRRDKTTLRDIAAAAGVSVATVSRALSRPHMVSPQLRERIDTLCRERRYIPNHAARSLTLDRSAAVGLVVPTIANPVFSPLIEAVQDFLEPYGYGLLIHCCHRDAGREMKQSRALIERGVDGIILGNPQHDPSLFDMLDSFGVPFVCVAGSVHGLERPSITYDAGAAVTLAIDHLIGLGHRAVAILSGPAATTPVIADRLAAAVAGLAAHGIAAPPEWCIEAGYAAAEASEGAARLLSGAPHPTAILCTGDLHALAAIAACHTNRLAVPGDISVIGCNDMAIAQFSAPPLSTVQTPYAAVGRRAAELLLELIAGQPIAPFTVLPSRLIERGSTGRPG